MKAKKKLKITFQTFNFKRKT